MKRGSPTFEQASEWNEVISSVATSEIERSGEV